MIDSRPMFGLKLNRKWLSCFNDPKNSFNCQRN